MEPHGRRASSGTSFEAWPESYRQGRTILDAVDRGRGLHLVP